MGGLNHSTNVLNWFGTLSHHCLPKIDIDQSAKQQEENSFSSDMRRPCVGRLHVNVCESEVYITIDRPAIKASKKPLNDK